ncbi:MATE family efflux transporter [Streptomyces sp. NPDC058092]|uniref:MATE family efflux transporter n=1 Tax=Streptomyces sp. NPDC058092 TaxID=3346336 RepID=UPI0036F1581E
MPETVRVAAPTEPSGLGLARDRAFVSALVTTAVPVTLQALLSTSRTMVDTVLVARLGTDEIAAIGYGSRVVFVVMLATMGMADGGAVIIAQFRGSGDAARARCASAVTTAITVGIAFAAFAACFSWARPLVAVATEDPRVIDLGAQYVRAVIGMILPFAVISSLAAALRCVGQARVAAACALVGILLHLTLAYALVFGHWGLPAYGVRGAGWATLASTCAEALLLVGYVYLSRNVMAFRLRDCVNGFRDGISAKVRRVGVPVSLSSTSWALGILAYSILVGRAGTMELAVLSMVNPLESFAIAVFIGVSTAAGVMVGSSLGERKPERTWSLSKALLIWTAGIAFGTCLVLLSAYFWLPVLYDGVAPETLGVARDTALVLGIVFLFRAMNITIQNGLLRAGGDTIFVLRVDIFTQWAVAVPLTALVTLVWDVPFPLVFLAINAEEIVRFFISGSRLLRRRWMRVLID